MTRIESVIFDWGNTLVDYPLRTTPEQLGFLASFLTDHADLLAPWACVDVASTARDPEWLAAFNRENDGFAVRPFRERMRLLLGEAAGPAFFDEIERRLCQRIFAAGIATDGAADLMERLRRSDFRVCILSNTPWGTSARHWREELARHPFVAGTPIVLCGDVGYRKPHRDAFQRCIETLGTAADATVMIGDSLASDVLGALDFGLSAIWFKKADEPNPARHPAGETMSDLAEHLGL